MTLLLDQPAVTLRPDGVVRVSGPDRLAYLHSLLSQDLQSAAAGTVGDFLYLDAKGNALAAGRAVVRDDDVLLVVPPDVTASFVEALQRFTFLLQAVTEDLSATWVMGALRGEGLPAVDGAPDEPLRAALLDGGALVRDRSGGIDVIGPANWVHERLAATGLPPAGDDDWEAWRIGAGQPGWATEIVPGRRAQELGLLPTHVHLRKGCYPGQESIAKIYNLGRPRRVLAVVEFSGPVSAGDPVTAGTKTGEITSAAAAGPAWVALALLPVDAQGALHGHGEVMVGDVPGRVRRRVGEGVAIPGA
jgi:tRNA-modifying protein YgfZ